ncbi:MAG: signal peptidase I [Planctomycetia bacterium]|nr:signal peptidase I [Planctomycetia bacterium]
MAELTKSPSGAAHRSGWLRTIIELVACFVILVTMFRTFLAGAYMIETGSMAPCLLGKHRAAVCPSCRFSFAVEGTGSVAAAVCPNCGRGGIAYQELPESYGDHLLVHRGTFEVRSPRRWEVIVFQNPNKLRQAYVKRVVGLPGESVEVKGGDVYVSGKIQAKTYATQCGVRIPVYDHDLRPPDDDDEWRPRWIIDRPAGGWRAEGGAFHFTPGKPSSDQWEWVHYRNWIRRGGFHATSVPLTHWPESLDRLQGGFKPLRYDAESQTLVCRGAMPASLRDQILAGVDDVESQSAIERLYEASHIAPIVDIYGYNGGRDGEGHHEVRDLMIALRARWGEGNGEFALAMTDGTHEFRCVFDRKTRTVQLIEEQTSRTLRTATLDDLLFTKGAIIELSLMDRQVLMAIDGKPAFEPWSFPGTTEQGPTPWQPVRFAARGGKVDIDAIKLYRDVYYTSDLGRRGTAGPVQLLDNEFFVLGDNSPVSKDSRSWSGKAVLTGDLLVGKPLVVHVPSRKQRIRIGGLQQEIRIPEFSQMRYIH